MALICVSQIGCKELCEGCERCPDTAAFHPLKVKGTPQEACLPKGLLPKTARNHSRSKTREICQVGTVSLLVRKSGEPLLFVCVKYRRDAMCDKLMPWGLVLRIVRRTTKCGNYLGYNRNEKDDHVRIVRRTTKCGNCLGYNRNEEDDYVRIVRRTAK